VVSLSSHNARERLRFILGHALIRPRRSLADKG
jgi:hypothetical protein